MPAKSDRPELVVIIPAKNEAFTLPVVFECLLEQDYEHMRESPVIVADAGSTDGTLEAIARYQHLLNIRVIPGGMPGAGRNAGTRASDSDYLLFLDADVQLGDQSLVRRVVERARRENLYLVAAELRCPTGRPIDVLFYRFNNLVVRCSRYVSPFAPGAFMLWRREAFTEMGMFDEEAHFAEDYQLSRQVPKRRFAVERGPVLVDNERFVKWGYFRMAKLFLRTMIFGRREGYFRVDRGYWDF